MKNIKHAIAIGFAIGISGPIIAEEIPGAGEVTYRHSFSNTQGDIGADFVSFVDLPSLAKVDWKKLIELPTPPPNGPEAARIVALQQDLNEERIAEIEEQATATCAALLPEMKGKEKTELLMQLLQNELGIALIGQKMKFDRARPSFVNSKVKAVIPVPPHPSYPSGHSAQFHLFGFALAALTPSETRKILLLANEISENREYAGLHYQSDTIAGELLARRMTEILASNEIFQAAFLAAATEWGPEEEANSRLRLFASFALRPKKAN